MKYTYSDDQLVHIREQAVIYQCACPSQVCVALDGVRKLHAYQARCLDDTLTDHAVHERIKAAAETAHRELEACLTDVLVLEGWDLDTLEMPEQLQKRLLGDD